MLGKLFKSIKVGNSETGGLPADLAEVSFNVFLRKNLSLNHPRTQFSEINQFFS